MGQGELLVAAVQGCLPLIEQLVEQLCIEIVDGQVHAANTKMLADHQLGERVLVVQLDARGSRNLCHCSSTGPCRAEHHAFIKPAQSNARP